MVAMTLISSYPWVAAESPMSFVQVWYSCMTYDKWYCRQLNECAYYAENFPRTMNLKCKRRLEQPHFIGDRAALLGSPLSMSESDVGACDMPLLLAERNILRREFCLVTIEPSKNKPDSVATERGLS
jgi:hypothetical protein